MTPAKKKGGSKTVSKKATPKKVAATKGVKKVSPKKVATRGAAPGRAAPTAAARQAPARKWDFRPDPRLDLVLERTIDVPVEKVWAAWTNPEHLKKWFVPRPWTLKDCEIDVRPGGIFRTTMRSPEGEEFPGTGCYLDVVPNERLVWTDALGPGYRPSEKPFFTAVVTMEPKGKGTHYRAVAVHKDEAIRKQHDEMGFHEGWGTVLEQMIEFAKTL